MSVRIFVIDKRGIVRYVDVHNIDLQPDNEELFRILGEIEPELAAAYDAAEAKKAAAAQPVAAPDGQSDHVLHALVSRLPAGSRLAGGEGHRVHGG